MKSLGWVCVLCLSLLITELTCEAIDEDDDDEGDDRREAAEALDVAGDNNEVVKGDAPSREARSVDGGVKELRRGGSGHRGGGGGGGGGSGKRGKKKSNRKKTGRKGKGRGRG